MKQHKKRKCLNCQDLFRPDPRNVRHQRYCSKAPCRKASKAAAQRRWRNSPLGRDYFKGPTHVQRVQAWRAAHPGYWKRGLDLTEPALQDHSLAQAPENNTQSHDLTKATLQDLLSAQPFVLIGLIAHLTGNALQDDIANAGRHLRQLGSDIIYGADHAKTSVNTFASAFDPPPIQLDRPAPGA